MLNYILRRMFLMIPTLIGITFLVFMLIAASPGGIGAGLLVSGGAMQSQNAIAIQKAKLEDRYGLNEPVVVQYFRWLARISPVKFGARDLLSPSGEIVTRPRPVPEPTAWRWFANDLPEVDEAVGRAAREQLNALDADQKSRVFSRMEAEYVNARAGFTAANALLEDAIKRYVEEWDRGELLTRKRELRTGRLRGLEPDKTLASYAEVQTLGAEAVAAYKAAIDARAAFIGGMDAKPYPQTGIGIIPGVVSVSAPDLGVAFSRGRPVIDLIGEALPVTLLLNIIAFPIIYMVAIPSGMLAAVRRGTFADVGLGSMFIGLYSIPVVLAGVLMLGFMANPDYLNAFPTAGLHGKGSENFTFLPGAGTRGWLLDHIWHIVLPVTCLVYTGFAVLSKQTRAAMLENLSADYVRTAKAKGVPGRRVILGHVFRNSLLPLITMFVTIFPAMLAGSVVIERIFSIPGMGWLLIEGINLRDRELILANTTMVACVNLLALLLADILYAMADPRITYK